MSDKQESTAFESRLERATCRKLVRLVNKAPSVSDAIEMRERNTVIYDASCVNTDVAYEVWGLDIGRLERSFKKLQAFGEVSI